MNTTRFATVRLWIVRAILLFATLLYLEIGRRFLFDPAATIGRFGIVLPQPVSVTTVRAIMGAFFLGLSAIALLGLVVRARMTDSLKVMLTFIFFVLCGRIFGLVTDGADPGNLGEFRNEATGCVLYTLALILAPRPGQV